MRRAATATLHGLQGDAGAAHVVNSKFHASIGPEIKLSQIAVQMLFTAVLVDANHAALKDREEPFEGIGVDLATVLAEANVADAVIDKLVLLGGTEAAINLAAIGVQDAFRVDIGLEHGLSG